MRAPASRNGWWPEIFSVTSHHVCLNVLFIHVLIEWLKWVDERYDLVLLTLKDNNLVGVWRFLECSVYLQAGDLIADKFSENQAVVSNRRGASSLMTTLPTTSTCVADRPFYYMNIINIFYNIKNISCCIKCSTNINCISWHWLNFYNHCFSIKQIAVLINVYVLFTKILQWKDKIFMNICVTLN